MGAVHAESRPRVDVQLPVDDDMVTLMERYVRGEVGVVIDLKQLVRGRPDVETLVTT